MVTPSGDAIPILSACGNHDAGSNAGSHALSSRFVDGRWVDAEIPFMFAFLPHRAAEVADVQSRQPFHLHRISSGGGALEVFVLDSGHVVEYNDPRQIECLLSSSRPAMGDKGAFRSRACVQGCSYHVLFFERRYQLGFSTRFHDCGKILGSLNSSAWEFRSRLKTTCTL